MKFLVLKTKDRQPNDPQFRLFLADGTELVGAYRIVVSGRQTQRTVTRHAIDEPSPDKLHFEVDRLELEFAGPEVEMIDEVPPSFEARLGALASKWRTSERPDGGWFGGEDAKAETRETCAEELEALLNEVNL